MTPKQLAKLANVSHSTASKALRYSKELNDETIELVNRVARENGYFLQQKKQRLAAMKHRPLKFAIICPEIVSVHYASIATELNDILWEQNAIAQIHVCNFDDETEREIMLRCLEAADINGVISLSQRHSQFDLRFPTVRMSNAPTDSVGFDYTGGMRKALLYLKEAGHRKIGFIGEKLTTPKRDTFLALTDELGLSADPGCIIDSDRRFEAAGFHAVAGLLASGRELPTAVMTAYDEIAFGAVSALLQHGYRVPQDISVVGLNNVPAAAYFPVPLTTIGFDTDRLCRTIVRTIFELLSSDEPVACLPVETDLILRASAGPARA